jgi:hypothetical protein
LYTNNYEDEFLTWSEISDALDSRSTNFRSASVQQQQQQEQQQQRRRLITLSCNHKVTLSPNEMKNKYRGAKYVADDSFLTGMSFVDTMVCSECSRIRNINAFRSASDMGGEVVSDVISIR